MIASIVALAAMAQVQELPTAGALISKMLAHYGASKDCQSLTGTITLTLSTARESSIMDTYVQFERPSLVYIKESLRSGGHAPWLIVSDGKHFSYNRPEQMPFGLDKDTTFGQDRLMEAVDQSGWVYNVQDIYQAGGSTLKERSLPLDLAFGRSQDLRYNVEKWATHQLLGKEEIRGISAYVVGGDWRQYGMAPVSDHYRMWISETGDLLRYEISGVAAIPDQSGRQAAGPQKVVSVWDVQLTPNAPADKTLFKL